ncbi:S1 family peptidase [Geopsychrobacter electrodiphilus]|uniref:S1 family peptidase n=1 Tax=Geopsychrobacter electrodiphilus TaxID=225196 RepID=UPI0003609EF5|nr:serine protease [Geopsychrobacter electrodiphilus]
MHQRLADSIFRIVCGQSSGSGFSFRSDAIVITNHHVIEAHLVAGQPIIAVTEGGQQFQTKLLSHSDKSQYDFAILEIRGPLPAGRNVLLPKPNQSTSRGERIAFAGFPHGIHDLLVHEAIISGPVNDHAFYIDGSVNGGNSGGPIVDVNTGGIIGIVTQRRFLGGQSLQQLGLQVSQLSQQCAGIANRGSVQIMGIDFGGFANMMAQGFGAMSQVIEANANSGIGIGFKIEFVNQEFERLGLK